MPSLLGAKIARRHGKTHVPHGQYMYSHLFDSTSYFLLHIHVECKLALNRFIQQGYITLS